MRNQHKHFLPSKSLLRHMGALRYYTTIWASMPMRCCARIDARLTLCKSRTFHDMHGHEAIIEVYQGHCNACIIAQIIPHPCDVKARTYDCGTMKQYLTRWVKLRESTRLSASWLPLAWSTLWDEMKWDTVTWDTVSWVLIMGSCFYATDQLPVNWLAFN